MGSAWLILLLMVVVAYWLYPKTGHYKQRQLGKIRKVLMEADNAGLGTELREYINELVLRNASLYWIDRFSRRQLGQMKGGARHNDGLTNLLQSKPGELQ